MRNSLREFNITGIKIKAFDSVHSWSSYSIANEIKTQYLFDDIKINDNDIMIDIGGHIGMVSMFYAKKYPNISIEAYEPTKRNYFNFFHGINENDLNNIKLYNLAVSDSDKEIFMYQPIDNTGGSTSIFTDGLKAQSINVVKTIKLSDIIHNRKIKILKIDCEGAEYDILSGKNINQLKNVEYVLGELHHRDGTKYNAFELYDKISKIVGQENNRLTIIKV